MKLKSTKKVLLYKKNLISIGDLIKSRLYLQPFCLDVNVQNQCANDFFKPANLLETVTMSWGHLYFHTHDNFPHVFIDSAVS